GSRCRTAGCTRCGASGLGPTLWAEACRPVDDCRGYIFDRGSWGPRGLHSRTPGDESGPDGGVEIRIGARCEVSGAGHHEHAKSFSIANRKSTLRTTSHESLILNHHA